MDPHYLINALTNSVKEKRLIYKEKAPAAPSSSPASAPATDKEAPKSKEELGKSIKEKIKKLKPQLKTIIDASADTDTSEFIKKAKNLQARFKDIETTLGTIDIAKLDINKREDKEKIKVLEKFDKQLTEITAQYTQENLKKYQQEIILDSILDLLKLNDVEVTAEQIKNALRYYELGKYDSAKENDEAKKIIDIIIANKAKIEDAGIKISYMGSSDGTDHRLRKAPEWHKQKAAALTKLLAFFDAGKLTVASGSIDLSTGSKTRKLIEEYISEVTLNNKGYEVVEVNKDAFLKGGAIFDAALDLQRAEDIKRRIEKNPDAGLDGAKDSGLVIELGTTKNKDDERRSGLVFAIEQAPAASAAAPATAQATPATPATPAAPAVPIAPTAPTITATPKVEPPAPTKDFAQPAPDETAETQLYCDYELSEDKLIVSDSRGEDTYAIDNQAGAKLTVRQDNDDPNFKFIHVQLGNTEARFQFDFRGHHFVTMVMGDKPSLYATHKIDFDGKTITIAPKPAVQTTAATPNPAERSYIFRKRQTYSKDSITSPTPTVPLKQQEPRDLFRDTDTYVAAALTEAQIADPETITTLTVAQADRLIEGLYESGGELDLSGLTAIDAATAEKLAAFKGNYLSLSGLTTLNAATAEKLAAFQGNGLDLSGLTTLNAATAEKLAAFKGDVLDLSGLTTLDAATAEKLAAFKGKWLDLSGLTTLDAATAEKLAAFKGNWISFRGLTTLDAATKNALKKFETGNKQLIVSDAVRTILDAAAPAAPTTAAPAATEAVVTPEKRTLPNGDIEEGQFDKDTDKLIKGKKILKVYGDLNDIEEGDFDRKTGRLIKGKRTPASGETKFEKGEFDKDTGRLIKGTLALKEGTIFDGRFGYVKGREQLIEGTLTFLSGNVYEGKFDEKTGKAIEIKRKNGQEKATDILTKKDPKWINWIRETEIVSPITEITSTNFEKFISEGTVVVEVGATWCKPCKVIKPFLREAAAKYKGKIKFGLFTEDSEENRKFNEKVEKIKEKYRVEEIPTILIFKDGNLQSKIGGGDLAIVGTENVATDLPKTRALLDAKLNAL